MDSMTGFGRGEAVNGRTRATVEIRSVNNRYCEVSVYQPRDLAEHEGTIVRLVKDRLQRGKVQVRISTEAAQSGSAAAHVDAEAVLAIKATLDAVREAAGIDLPVSLPELMAYQDRFILEESMDEEPAWPAVQDALHAALDAIVSMRHTEGEILKADLAERLSAIETEAAAVETRAPERVEEGRQKLIDRLEELIADERVDEARLNVEIAVLADRLDITEELVRLASHIEVFRETMKTDEPVGRKLNFLSQEMNREINTIGSKANDADIAHRAVTMKEELEKIREQVQNIV
ncbi:MAG: YicC/YloC family endoribonuclease [Bacteroidota bacterium]